MLRTKAKCPSVHIVCFYWGGRTEKYIEHKFVTAQTKKIQRKQLKGGCPLKKKLNHSDQKKEGNFTFWCLYMNDLFWKSIVLSSQNQTSTLLSVPKIMYSLVGEINTAKRYSTKKYFVIKYLNACTEYWIWLPGEEMASGYLLVLVHPQGSECTVSENLEGRPLKGKYFLLWLLQIWVGSGQCCHPGNSDPGLVVNIEDLLKFLLTRRSYSNRARPYWSSQDFSLMIVLSLSDLQLGCNLHQGRAHTYLAYLCALST